jgi:hypothetical protein
LLPAWGELVRCGERLDGDSVRLRGETLELANPFGLECFFFFPTMVDNSLVLENQSKPQYNLKTKTDHSTLIARTLPLSKTLRDKIPKATMKITDFVKPH